MLTLRSWLEKELTNIIFEALQIMDPLVSEMWDLYYADKVESITNGALYIGLREFNEFLGCPYLVEHLREFEEYFDADFEDLPPKSQKKLETYLNEAFEEIPYFSVEAFIKKFGIRNPHTKATRNGLIVIGVSPSLDLENAYLSSDNIRDIVKDVGGVIGTKMRYEEEEAERIIAALDKALRTKLTLLYEEIRRVLGGKRLSEIYRWVEYDFQKGVVSKSVRKLIKRTGTEWPPESFGEPIFVDRGGGWMTFSSLKGDLYWFSENITLPGVVEFWTRLKTLVGALVHDYESTLHGEILARALEELARDNELEQILVDCGCL